MTSTIISSIKNDIGSITLNHPAKSNAIDVTMRDELIQAYREFDNHPMVRIITLNANGKNFCAGADLHHMYLMSTASFEENLHDAKQFAQLFHTIYSCKKPTVAYAFGKVIGGGLGLLSACDIAVAAHDTTFCFSEVKLGLVPAVISPFVTQRIGYQHAKYLMMTAELFDTQKALKIGLIDHADEMDLSVSLLHHSQSAMCATKKWLNQLHPISAAQIDESALLLAKRRCDETTKITLAAYLKMHSANSQ